MIYSLALLSKRLELQARLAERDPITVERCPDSVDDMLQYSARDFAALDIERTQELLRQVNAALERIQDGSYGVCLECEEPIAARRLAAVPWAAHCLSCAEKAEQERRSPAVDCGEVA